MLPRAASLLVLLPLAACSGGASLGTELRMDTPLNTTATLSYTEAVDRALAETVLARMVEGNYNFGSNLPEQLDRVDGRLTLRLGNDNEDTIADVIADAEGSGVLNYMHGLAFFVSQAIDGEAIDVELHRETLGEPFHVVTWDPSRH
ncbi:MAG: hypothetical protein ACYTF3_07110 [Planctomycetota bacterium]|jgi:hypothetical protein